MSITAAERSTLRHMLLTGYLPSTAAFELSTRAEGPARADLQAAADEIAAEVRGTYRPLPSLTSALAARRSIFGAHEAEVAA